MSRSRVSRAKLRARESTRKSSSHGKPHITPVSDETMAAYLSHVAELASSQPIGLDVFSVVELFNSSSLDPVLTETAMEWMAGVSRGTAPLCLCCDNRWKSFADVPPAGFAVVVPFSRDSFALCSGLCETCFDRQDLLARCMDCYKQLFGEGIYRQTISPSTDQVQ